MDHQPSIGSGSTMAGASRAPLPPSLTGATLDRLSEMRELAAKANSSLIDVRSRLFGAWPQSGETSAANIKEAPSGQEGDVRDAFDQLRRTLLDIGENAATLNARV